MPLMINELIMNTHIPTIEQAVMRASYELAQDAGEIMASAAAAVFLNALSDVAERVESAAIGDRQAFAFYLRLCGRVCGLPGGK